MSVLGDVIIDAIQSLLRLLFSPIEKLIEDNADALIQTVVSTPHPNSVYYRPTNGAWPDLYDFHWDTMVPLTLGLWGASIGLVIFLESTSHLFSSYHRSKLKRRALSGLLGILSWWWVAAIALRFTDALSGFLVPSLSNVSLFETLSFSSMGVLGLVIALMTNFTLFVLIGVIYFVRHIVLYLFVLMMPILIVLWIPGVGPFGLVSQFMKRLAGFFVPFLFMTVPVALLFRLGELLGSSASLSMGGVGAWLTGLVIPLIAVVSPFILFWQAGALFFMAERASYHVSAQRARTRANRTRAAASEGNLGRRNFVRGVKGEQAVNGEGQAVLASGNSRAHAAGSRLNAAGSSLRERLDRGGDGGNGGGSGGQGASPSSRNEDFETLRDRSPDRPPSGESRSSESTTERPYYID